LAIGTLLSVTTAYSLYAFAEVPPWKKAAVANALTTMESTQPAALPKQGVSMEVVGTVEQRRNPQEARIAPDNGSVANRVLSPPRTSEQPKIPVDEAVNDKP